MFRHTRACRGYLAAPTPHLCRGNPYPQLSDQEHWDLVNLLRAIFDPSMFKRGIVGVYHHVSPKHLDRYAAEFAGRHNLRDLDTIDQMAEIARGMQSRRLRYADLTA